MRQASCEDYPHTVAAATTPVHITQHNTCPPPPFYLPPPPPRTPHPPEPVPLLCGAAAKLATAQAGACTLRCCPACIRAVLKLVAWLLAVEAYPYMLVVVGGWGWMVGGVESGGGGVGKGRAAQTEFTCF